MIDQPNAYETAGLFFDGDAIKGALLSLKRGEAFLDKIVFIESPVDNVNPLYMSEQVGKLTAELGDRLVVSAVETHESLLRPLHLKLKKEKDIAAVLAFQAEPLLPYPIDNAQLDWVMTQQSAEGSDVMVVAVRKDHLAHHLQRWQALDVESEVVSTVPYALAAFARICCPQEESYFILDISKEYTTCVLMGGGKVLAAQSCHQRISNLKQAFDGLRLEVMKLLYALAKGQEVGKLLVTGDAAIDSSLVEKIGEELNKELITIMPPSGFQAPPEKLLTFAIPIGLALTGLPKAAEQINFRSGENAYPHPWRRVKQPVLFYLGSCLLLAVALFFCGNAYVAYKKDIVREQFVSLLAFMNKPYNIFESEYEVKHPFHLPLEEGENAPVDLLDNADLMERLEFLEGEIKNAPDMIALLPNVPRVSDLLAWLATHPAISKIDEKTGKVVPLAQIDNLSYVMVSRPEEKKKGNRYQVKVEMEFTSPTPMMARELHDALIAPNDFVDPKMDVKWSTNRGKYKTSFYLKDKTIYPSQAKSGRIE